MAKNFIQFILHATFRIKINFLELLRMHGNLWLVIVLHLFIYYLYSYLIFIILLIHNKQTTTQLKMSPLSIVTSFASISDFFYCQSTICNANNTQTFKSS